MDNNTLKLLEFTNILKYLSIFCASESAKSRCLELKPEADILKIKKSLLLLKEAIGSSDEISKIVYEFPPLEGLFIHISKGNNLDEDGLFALRIFLEKSKRLKEVIQGLDQRLFPTFIEKFSPIPWPQETWMALKRCVDLNGEIKDQASPGLLAVRDEIRKIQKKCTKKINDYISELNIGEMVRDEYLTISSDRYVIALKSNFKGRVKGIIHDYSQSGETCYFEPIFLVELNNRLQELKNKEREEKNKILKYLTSLVTHEQEKIETLYSYMIELDILQAKIIFNEKIKGNIVSITTEEVALKNSRHPLLYLKHKGEIEPIDIVLKKDQKGLILTGGNSGGKTVSLKTLGLCALMAYCGLPIPCDEGSSIPFWKDIFVFLGDEQSLQESLSTFTAQIKKLKDIWPKIDNSTLVLLDEFGTGTDPSQGAALAQAVIESLLEKGSWIFAITHFPSLKLYALERENVRAAMVLFDPSTKKPLYKIAYDQVGHSQALEVAKEFGMPKEILSKARKYLLINNEETTRIVEKLNKLAVQRERELQKLQMAQKELDQKKRELKTKYEKEIQKLIQDINTKVKEILISYREQKIQRKEARKRLKQYREILKQKIEVPKKIEPPSFEEIRIGLKALYLPWDKKGTIEEIDQKKNKIKVNVSGVSMWVKLEEISILEKIDPDRDKNKCYMSSNTKATYPYSLDIRGKRIDEAEVLLNQFLDKAIYTGKREVEIIHGRGQGILRRFVHEILKNFPHIESFSFATEDRGGDGVTIVKLR